MNSNISVVIPTYRSALYIRETLESIFAQTLNPKEIIVIDDCSSDETVEIVESCRANCPTELRIIQLPCNSGGPAGPMNVGVAAARSELIAMLDHDDRMFPQRLERALPSIQADDRTGIVFNQFDFFDETRDAFSHNESRYDHLGKAARKLPASETLQMLVTNGFPYGGAGGMMFRKSMWQELGGFRSQFRIVWDYDFGIRAAVQGWDTYYLPNILYQHRVHASNLETSGGGQRNTLEHFELFQDLSQNPTLTDHLKNEVRQKLARYVFRIADSDVLRKDYRHAAYFYWQALLNGQHPTRAVRGFLRIPYRYIRGCLGLSNKGDPIGVSATKTPAG